MSNTNSSAQSLTRRSFIALGAIASSASLEGAASAQNVTGDTSFEFNEVTIDQIQEGLKTGKWTVHNLAEKYLARIEEIDRKGPTLKSVIEVNSEVLSQAETLDRELKAGKSRGRMHGVPILLKDNIDTTGMQTTAGSLALVGSKPEDAFLVKRLREAGALILGKTNLSEWANIRCSYSTSGWSGRGGLTKNPYCLDRNPCGSSSGSGAAVAANLCVVAVGTETDGSIVSPSAANGIVGIKPTVGLVSRSGIIPISHSQDTAGPMARTVRDAAILLEALVASDSEDAATTIKERPAKLNLSGCFDLNGLKGVRLGVARNFFNFHEGTEAVMKEALESLQKAGAKLIDPADVPNSDKVGDPEAIVLSYELKADLNAYLEKLGPKAPVKNLRELIEFNIKNAKTEMPFFGQDQFEKAEARGDLNSYEYIEALARCRKLMRTEGIDALMDKFKLDAIIAPTMGPACMTDLVNGDRWLGGSSTPAAVAGYPSITVPAGFVYGLPVGLSFFGRAWSEATLIKLAFAFEQATKHRSPPKFLKTLEVKS
ncbi:amidase [Telmatocola sphagniphila]|uniref:Amidase n=1 Tax=Telmatocola sphagniphila TaxID=1123043 RepID=A0A8E6BCY1_9BACT|nr:amidase [Telmatocola sphagniphila]QVL34610.1 amidase [Telmatocola sphagniphila]